MPLVTWIHHSFVSFLEKRPTFGYVIGAATSGSGFWALVENTTKLLALVSVVIGVVVGVYTIVVHRRTLKKLELEMQTLRNSRNPFNG